MTIDHSTSGDSHSVILTDALDGTDLDTSRCSRYRVKRLGSRDRTVEKKQIGCRAGLSARVIHTALGFGSDQRAGRMRALLTRDSDGPTGFAVQPRTALSCA